MNEHDQRLFDTLHAWREQVNTIDVNCTLDMEKQAWFLKEIDTWIEHVENRK